MRLAHQREGQLETAEIQAALAAMGLARLRRAPCFYGEFSAMLNIHQLYSSLRARAEKAKLGRVRTALLTLTGICYFPFSRRQQRFTNCDISFSGGAFPPTCRNKILNSPAENQEVLLFL